MLSKSVAENMVLSIFGLYLGFKYCFNVKKSMNPNRQFTLVFLPIPVNRAEVPV